MSLKKCVLAAAVASGLGLSGSAFAGPVLVLDLQLDSGSPTVQSGIRAITNPVANQTYNLQVWGTILDDPNYTGTTGAPIAGDGFVSADFRLVQNEGSGTGITGNYLNGVKGPFASLGSNGSSHTAYDAVGGTDWGGAAPVSGSATSTTGYFTGSNTSRQPFSNGTSILLGTIQWTDTLAGVGSTLLQVIPYINGSSGRGAYNFQIGGTIFNSGIDPASQNLAAVDTNQRIRSGIPLAIIPDPEPGTLGIVLLGSSVLWRRRRSVK